MFTRTRGLDGWELSSSDHDAAQPCGCNFEIEDEEFEFTPCNNHSRAVVPADEVNTVLHKLIPLLNHLQIQLPMLTDTEAGLVTDLRELLKEEL